MGVLDDLLKKTKEAARKNAKTRAAGKKKKKKASAEKKQTEQKRSFTQTRNIDRVRGSRKTTSAPSSKPEEEKKRDASTAAWDKFGRSTEGSGLRESMRPVEEEKRNVDPVALQGNTGRTREELERIDTQRELAPYDDYDWLKANLQAVESRNKNKGVGPMAVPDPELDTEFDFREASGQRKMSETADTLIQNWDKVSAENRVDTANYILQAYGFNDQTRGIIMDTFKNASDSDKLKMLETAVYITGQSDDVKAMQDMVNNSPTIASAEVDHSSEAQSERAMRTLNRSMVNDYRTYQEQQKYIDRFVEDGRYSRGDALKFKAAYHVSNIGQNRLNSVIMGFSDWLRQGQDGYDIGFTDNKMQRWSESKNIFDLAATVGGDVLHDLFSAVGLPVSMLSKLFLDESDLQDLTDFAMGLNQGYMDRTALENRIYESANLSAVDRFALDTMGVVIEMIPTILMSITGAPTLGMTDFATSAAGASARQAYEQGATLEESVKYGLSIGTAEAMTEKMFTGFGYMGKGFIAPFVRKLIPEEKILTGATRRILQESGFMDSVSYRIMKGVVASGGEATEEMVMEVVTPYIERATYNPEAMNATISEIGYAGGLGAMAAAVMGLPVTITDVASAKDKSRTYDQIVDDFRNQKIAQLNEAVEAGYMTEDEAKATLNEINDTLNGVGSLNVSDAVPEEKVAGEALDTVYDSYEDAKKAMMQEARTKKDGEKITANYIDNGVVKTFSTTAKGGTLGLGRSTEAGKEYQRIAQAKNVTERSGYQLNVKEEIIKEVSSLSKAIGREVEFYRNDDATDHGYMDKKTGKIYINAGSSQSAARSVIAHELTHQMENTAGWSKLVELMKKHYGSSYESRRQERIDAYEAFGKPLKVDETRKTYDEADQELVAMFVEEKLLTDAETIREVVNTDKTLAQKIIAWINKVIQKLAGSKEQKMLVEARDLWNQALQEEQAHTGKDYIQYEGATIAVDAGAEIRFSQGKNNEMMKAAERYNEEHHLVDTAELEQAKKDREYISKTYNKHFIADSMTEEDASPIQKNGSYGLSVENTSICSRSLIMESMVERIANRLGRPLENEESIVVASELRNYTGDQAECLFCYQTNAKRAYENGLAVYLRQREAVISRFKGGMDDELNYRIMMEYNFTKNKWTKKDSPDARDRFNTFIKIAKGEVKAVPALYMANTRVLKMQVKNPANSPEFIKQLKQAEVYAQGASRAHARIYFAVYEGQILEISQDVIDRLNSEYGLRMFSYSDFSLAFLLENMQMVTDASVVGLQVLSYTKNTDFVDIFAGTDMAINMSLAGFSDGKGGYICDGMQSMEWEQAKKYREQYPYVGTVYVAFTDEEVVWAVNQDWIDTVIPFHISGGSGMMQRYQGWKNYSSVQSESKLDGWDENKHKAALYPTDHQNNKEEYLRLCKENHLRPKFAKFLTDPRTKDNYMKLVNETRVPPSEMTPVHPVFNLENVDAMYERFTKEGGYGSFGGKTEETLEKIAEDIYQKVLTEAPEVLKKSKSQPSPAKQRNDNYIQAVVRGDMETAHRLMEEAANDSMKSSKVRDEDGNLIYLYHGTDADFSVFDTDKNGGKNGLVEGFGIYTTDSEKVAESYGNRKMKLFANIKKPATSTSKTIKKPTLVKLIKDTCEKQANEMVREDGYGNINDALRDTWISNYVFTYDMPIANAYEEVATMILDANDNDMDIIREVMAGMAIRDYSDANKFYKNSLMPVTKIDGFITEWTDDSTGEKSKIVIPFVSNQLKSAETVTRDDAGNIIPLTKRFKQKNDDIRRSVGKSEDFENKTVYLSNERIDALIQEFGASNPKYSQAYVTKIQPSEFLYLTSSDVDIIRNDSEDIDMDRLRNNKQTPYLRVDLETGEIVGHEGRHRMAALERAGVKYVAIVVIPLEKGFNRSNPQYMEWQKVTEQFPISYFKYSTYLDDLIPINENHREEIRKTYGENNISNKIRGVRYSIGATKDAEYMEAVESGDMGIAQRLVREAANIAGFTSPKLYHGTKSFGFTQLRTKDLDIFGWSPFFATPDPNLAETYSGETERRQLRGGYPKATQDQIDEHLSEHYGVLKKRIRAIDKHLSKPALPRANDAKRRSLMKDARNELANMVEAQDAKTLNEAYNRYIDAVDALEKTAMLPAEEALFEFDEFHKAQWEINRIIGAEEVFITSKGKLVTDENREEIESDTAGIYSFYANLDGMLDIDGEGENWNHIDGSKIGKDKDVKTRDVALYAKENGYTGVIIRNIYDSGGQTGYYEPGDIYIFFEPASQVKSADTVTYDDNNEVIPLSERFNEENNDIRWSVGYYEAKYKKGDKFHWLGEAVTVDEVLKERGFPDTYILRYEDGSTDAVKGDELMSDEDAEKYNAKKGNAVFGEDVVEYRVGERVTLGFGEKGYIKDKYRMSGSEYAYTVDLDNGDTMTHITADDIVNHMRDIKHINDGYVPPARKSKAQIEISKNYLVGDTVSYMNERASIVERNNPKGGTLTYTLELDNGDRVEVTADQLQVGVTPELHFDELPKEEQEAWHEPPADWDMSRQIEDVYAEPITVSEFLELLYENGITVSKRTMNTWFRDHGFYEKRKKKNEKDRISEKGQKSGMFKKEGKDIMITEEGQKYFLQTFLHADKETVNDLLESGKIKLPTAKTDKKSPLEERAYVDMANEYEDEIFDTGIDYWWATLLTGKGVTYSKDYARNFDAAAQNNPEARKYLQKYFVRPLETAKADYASNVRDKLESIKKKMAELGIQMDTEKASAVQWIGEGQYQDKYGDLHKYTLENLKEEFPDDWENIKAAEEFFREMYDQYLKDINQAREKIYPHPLEDAQDKMAAYEARRDRAAERIADQRAIIADIEKVLVAKKAEILKKKRTDTKVYANLQNSIRYNEERLARAKEHLNDYIDRKNKYDVLANEIRAAIDSGDILRNKRIIPRKDYFHHFQELTVGLGDVFSMSNNTSEIDPRLEGTSGYTEPRSKFSGVTLHRKHGRYKADAIEGMVRYVQTGEYMIHIDPVISEFRNHIVGMAKVTKDSRNANKLIRWLVQWTNDLAGKTNPADRFVQDVIGRETMKKIKWINSRAKANAVVGNLSSASAQFFNFPNLQAYVNDPKAYTAGLRDLFRFIRRDKDTRLLMRQSGFLNERYLDDAINALETKAKDKISHAAQWTLVVGDRYTSAMVWFTAYNDAVNKGKKRPIEYADNITRRCVAGRGIGEIPLAQKSNITQIFAPFQIEVNNAYQLYKEKIVGAATGRTEKDKLVSAGQFGLILVMNFLMNTVTDLVLHRRVVYDPIYVFLQCLSDWKNGDDDEEEKNIAEKFAELLGRQAGEIISNIPYGSLLAYYGINSSWVRENIFGDQDPTRFGVSNIALDWAAGFAESLFTGKDIVDDVLSFGTTFLMPFGGKQTERTLQGLIDSGILPELKIGWKEGVSFGWKKAPGSYDKNGQLQFPLKSPISYDEDGKLQFGFDSVGDFGEWLTLLAFGKYATDEGQKYLGKDYESSTLLQNIFGFNKTKERTALSERATEVVETLAKNGSDVFEVYDTVREIQDAQNIFEKRNILAEADLTDAEKAKILLGYVVSEDNYESTLAKMNGVISVGLGVDDYLKIANLYSLINDSEEYQTATEKTLLFNTELASMGYTSEQIQGVNEVMAYFSHIPADTSKFDELIGLGLSTDTTLAIQKTLGELEPLEGETQVSSLQKAEAIAGMGLSKDEETAAMSIALDDNTYVKYKVVTDYGVDAQTWVDLQNALVEANANNPDELKRNKSYDKEEKKAALDSLDVSNETRAALWQILDNQLYSTDPKHNTAWKAGRNPYSSSVGAQVVEACIEGKSALAASKETDETESAYASPVSGDIVINSEYGYRIHPISGEWKMHHGLDIDGEQGDPVFAAAEGTVVKTVNSNKGYGNYVIIEHADGTQTLYAHMYSYGVEEGQTVSQGEQIGEVGSIGGTTGPHLHFEVRVDGQSVNPQTIFDFTGEGIVTESDPNYAPIVSGGGSSGGGSSGGSSRSGSTASVGSRTSEVASNRRSGGLTLPSVGGSGGNGGGSRASTPVAGMSTSAPTFGARGLYLPKASDYTPNRRSISSSVATTQRTGRTGGSFWDDNILS